MKKKKQTKDIKIKYPQVGKYIGIPSPQKPQKNKELCPETPRGLGYLLPHKLSAGHCYWCGKRMKQPTQPQKECDHDYKETENGLYCFRCGTYQPQENSWKDRLYDIFCDSIKDKESTYENTILFIDNLISEIRKEERELLAEKVKVRLETYVWDMGLADDETSCLMENRRELNKFVLAELIKKISN